MSGTLSGLAWFNHIEKKILQNLNTEIVSNKDIMIKLDKGAQSTEKPAEYVTNEMQFQISNTFNPLPEFKHTIQHSKAMTSSSTKRTSQTDTDRSKY